MEVYSPIDQLEKKLEEEKKLKEEEKIVDNILGLVGPEKNIIISRSNCKFCQSKVRIEAEEEYEKTGNIKKVAEFLAINGDKISYLSVRNHIQLHYLKTNKRMKLMEYASDLNQWKENQITMREHMFERIAMMRREMCFIAADSEGLELKERRQSADTIKKLSDGIGTLEDKILLMDAGIEPAEIIIEKIRDIMGDKIKNSNDPKVKQALIEVLKDLSKNVSDLLFEKK
jgi:hypothetical protein